MTNNSTGLTSMTSTTEFRPNPKLEDQLIRETARVKKGSMSHMPGLTWRCGTHGLYQMVNVTGDPRTQKSPDVTAVTGRMTPEALLEWLRAH